jgi:CHAT domain-containing protein
LHLLPLHALFSEKYTITYLPSAQIGLQLEPIPDPEHRLLIVNPPGEELLSALESAAISQFYPPERHQELREDKATHLEVIQTLQNDVSFSYFHFIGHAEHNFNNPKISALQLSNRKRLTLAYINKQSLDLSNYYLVCLPACETGLTGNASEIEEYVGLVSAFLAKGASYVISTLWKVDSQCTALAMIEFYQCLTREPNMNPITALKKVQHWLKDITYDKLQQWLLNLASEFPEDSRERESIEKLAKEAKEQANKVQPNYRPYKDPYWWASFKISGKTPIDI